MIDASIVRVTIISLSDEDNDACAVNVDSLLKDRNCGSVDSIQKQIDTIRSRTAEHLMVIWHTMRIEIQLSVELPNKELDQILISAGVPLNSEIMYTEKWRLCGSSVGHL